MALRNDDDLYDEASSMLHCVASYASDCAAGACFMYRVLAPTRATLEVRMDRGRPFVHQLTGRRNAVVPKETCEAVAEWMKGCGG